MNVHKVHVNNSDKEYVLDDLGYELFQKYTWFATYGDYPYLRAKVNKDGRILVLKFHIELMKEEILETIKNNPNKCIVDHINGDVYDNRKCNLRVRTQSENNMNKRIQSNNTTGIVGVSWHSRDKMWNAMITVNKKKIHLGYFYYLRNAVKARIEAEDKYFGEHSFRNRSEEYLGFIDSILNMPPIEEPFIMQVTRGRKYPKGVLYDKRLKKYKARINRGGIEEHKWCDVLEDAIEWRRKKEAEHYGDNIIYSIDKLEKQV